MPIQRSAFKELRKVKKRTAANAAVEALVRRDVKVARKALEVRQGDAVALVNAARKTLAKAARKGVIHPNRVARLTSRLEKKLAKVS